MATSRRSTTSSYDDDGDDERYRRDDYHRDYDGHDDDDEIKSKSTIRVIAPATLQEGYSFDVLVGNNPYSVVVPPGGVKEGQEFEVPYDDNNNNDDDEIMEKEEEQRRRSFDGGYNSNEDDEGSYYGDASCKEEEGGGGDDAMTEPIQTMSGEDLEDGGDGTTKNDNEVAIWYDEITGAPIGRWRTTLCSCCDVVTQSTFWMSFCCTPVLVAQLVTRLGLTWNGLPSESLEETSLSYNRIVLSMMIVLGVWKIPILGGCALLIYYVLIVVYVGSKVRSYIRQKYKIPYSTTMCLPTYCAARIGERCDDICCMVLCGCCSSIQMARHTHDDKEYPGHGCTTTGLGYDAPTII